MKKKKANGGAMLSRKMTITKSDSINSQFLMIPMSGEIDKRE